MGGTQRNRTHQMCKTRKPSLMVGRLIDRFLNGGFVKRIALDDNGAVRSQFGTPLGVPCKHRYPMPVGEQQRGKVASNIAAPANQKKGLAHGLITFHVVFILLFTEDEHRFKRRDPQSVPCFGTPTPPFWKRFERRRASTYWGRA